MGVRRWPAGSPRRAWRLYRDAAATEPEIARDWVTLGALRRDTLAQLLDGLIPEQALREGRERTADTVWAIASPETHELLVSGAGYTPTAYETWLAETLTVLTLRDDHRGP